MADELEITNNDKSLEDFIRSYIKKTPSITAKEKIERMFGADWKSASKSQKIASILSGLGGILTGQSQYDIERQNALEEYKVVAPALNRESTVLGAEERARLAKETADERNEIARLNAMTAKAKMESLKRYQEAAADVQAGNLELANKKFEHARQMDEENGPKLLNAAQQSRYYLRLKEKDPQKAAEWMQGFADFSEITGLSRGLGQGQGGTTVRESTGTFNVPVLDTNTNQWVVKKIPTESTSTSTRVPSGGPSGQTARARIDEILNRSRQVTGPQMPQQLGAPGPGQMPPQAPLQAPQQPTAAPQQTPGPQAVLQQMVRPPAPIGGGRQQRDVQSVPLCPQYARSQPEATARVQTQMREDRISGLARALPEWYASGALDDVAGTPEGWAEGIRKKMGRSTEEAQIIDWVVTKGVPSEINESSGLQFSQKEMEQAEKYWPRLSDHPRSILQRMTTINFVTQGTRYVRSLNLTPQQRDVLAGYWFKEMSTQSKRIVAMTEKARNTTGWKQKLPTQFDMDPRVVVAKSLRKARAENPGVF